MQAGGLPQEKCMLKSSGEGCTNGKGMRIFRWVSAEAFDLSKSRKTVQSYEMNRKCRRGLKGMSERRLLGTLLGEEKDGKRKAEVRREGSEHVDDLEGVLRN